jgi:hypothetical protein
MQSGELEIYDLNAQNPLTPLFYQKEKMLLLF